VILDTNVLVSALHFGGRPRRLLDDVLHGDHALIIGPAILAELEAVLVETCGWASDRAAAVRAEFEAIAEVVTPVEIPRVCRDPDDDRILAIAVIGAVDALVTGDSDLLALRTQGSVSITTVAGFEAMARG
jgi:putative PIN family toxin of toxin-antitoxin system